MSLFTDASLVLVPSGIKNQKVYSIVPTDGSGDLTFSRASNATRVNSSGLVEKVRTNEFNYSNTFNGTSWIINAATLTSGQSGYDGTSNAWKLTESATTAEHYIRQTPSVSGLLTISLYAKADTQDWVYFRGVTGGVNVRAWFDLQNGVVGTTNGSVLSRSIQSVGGGWYRCSMVWSHQSGFECYIGISNADGVVNYAGDGTSSILIQASQLETGDIATDYIATTTTAVSVGPVSGLPRLDYSGGASCPSLLLESQRTNAQTFSEDLTQGTAWGLGAITISANAITSPDGYQNADKVVESATTARHELYGQTLSYSGTTSISFYAKAGERRYLSCFIGGDPSFGGVTFDLQTGTAPLTSGGTTAKIEAVSGATGWYKCSYTTTKVASTTTYFCVRQTLGATPTVETYAGDGTSGLYLWGLQTELAGVYPSSYINTLSSAVTRVADYAYKTGVSSLIGQTEGTIYAEVNFDISVNQTFDSRIHLTDGGYSNWIFMGVPDGGSGNLPRFYVVSPSGTTSFYSSTALSQGVNKLAFGYKNGDMVAYLNGSQVATNTSAQTIPATSQIYIQGGSIGSGANERTNYKQVLLFKTRLSNADLATLTTI